MSSWSQSSVRETAKSYARGVAGGLLVAMPLLATMEMWWLGFYINPWKLILFLLLNFGVLVILEYYSGFRETVRLREEIRDALSAYGIGFVVAALILFAFHLLRPGMGWHEILGKIIIESIPISIGVSIAISQLGERKGGQQEQRKERAGFWGTQAIALAGALYFGFNIAPTVEPMLLGLRLSWWHVILLMVLSLALVHAIVFSLGFRGGRPKVEMPWYKAVMRLSLTSYLVALLLAAYLLWTFDRIGPETGLSASLHMIIVMGFVNSLGAAAGKLIL